MMDEPAAGPLTDGYGRRIDYLRVSVTDRCDLRCSYCLPKDFKGFETPANWLRHEEMARLVGLFVGLGVSKVRLTGGEPLLRRGVAGLAGVIAAMPGLQDLSVSTNGTQLVRHAQDLRAAGVDRLNISLDTLDAAAFSQITGRDCLESVLAGLAAAKEAGFAPIKLNSVVHAATPEAEVRRLLDYAVAQGFVLRLIEPMPMGSCGQGYAHTDLNAMGARLAADTGLVSALGGAGSGPARYWTTGHGTPVLGVITPMSRHFCASCNRVRLGVDGTLYLCLGQEDQVPLGRLLRAGASDAELIQAIRAGIAAKPERHDFVARPERIVRFMAQTGKADMRDIERLVDGFQRFQQQYYEDAPSLYRNLCEGQHPSTLLVGCCDSRVDPAMLLGCDPGDIFTVRNVANLVPPASTDRGLQGVLAAIQFAVEQLQVSRVIVLGHAHCGGIRALMDRRTRGDGETDYLERWMDIAEPARRQVLQQMPQATAAERRRACEQASILISLRNLEELSFVRRAVEAGSLTLHGWYFDLVAGALLAYSARADAFLPIVCPLFTELA